MFSTLAAAETIGVVGRSSRAIRTTREPFSPACTIHIRAARWSSTRPSRSPDRDDADGARIVFGGEILAHDDLREGRGRAHRHSDRRHRWDDRQCPDVTGRRVSLVSQTCCKGRSRRFESTAALSETLARLPIRPEAGFRGGTWGPRGVIVYGMPGAPGLQMIPDTGGQPERLAPNRPRAKAMALPTFSPMGATCCFSRRTGFTFPRSVCSTWTRARYARCLPASARTYVSSGHLLFVKDDVLSAVAFDVKRHEVIGTPVPILQDISIGDRGQLSVSSDGTLVYVRGYRGIYPKSRPVWVESRGRETPLPNMSADVYTHVRIAPSGAKVALAADSGASLALYVYNINRGSLTRIAAGRDPLWTPDGQRPCSSRQPEGSRSTKWAVFTARRWLRESPAPVGDPRATFHLSNPTPLLRWQAHGAHNGQLGRKSTSVCHCCALTTSHYAPCSSPRFLTPTPRFLPTANGLRIIRTAPIPTRCTSSASGSDRSPASLDVRWSRPDLVPGWCATVLSKR